MTYPRINTQRHILHSLHSTLFQRPPTLTTTRHLKTGRGINGKYIENKPLDVFSIFDVSSTTSVGFGKDAIDIPPLDLVSDFKLALKKRQEEEAAKKKKEEAAAAAAAAVEAKKSDANNATNALAASSGVLGAVDIPLLNDNAAATVSKSGVDDIMIPLLNFDAPSNPSDEPPVLNLTPSNEVPPLIINTPQTTSTANRSLSEEISYLKHKLAGKKLTRHQSDNLQAKLKKIQKELEAKSSSGGGTSIPKEDKTQTPTIDKSQSTIESPELVWGKPPLLSKKGSSRERRRERRAQLKEPPTSTFVSDRTMIPTKSFVLPRPKASSRGVLIPQFTSNVIKTQANATILANAGTTSILSTVIVVPNEVSADNNLEQCLRTAIQRRNAQNGSLFLPLQVEYRERWHASGKIPNNARRRDNVGPLTEKEVLTSRAVDRTLRPWLMKGLGDTTHHERLPETIMVNCQVQSYDTRSTLGQYRTHADPTALAINSAIAAIYRSGTSLSIPKEAAACIKLGMNRDGSVIYDPTPKEAEECVFELLFAGTKDRVLMFEFSAKGQSLCEDTDGNYVDPGISEEIVADALRLAQEAILPIIQCQEELRSTCSDVENEERNMSDEELARFLGLSTQMETTGVYESTVFDNHNMEKLLDEAFDFVWSKLESAVLKTFGYDGQSFNGVSSLAHVYHGNLPSKKLR
jgi:hypothetical protein